ncbi:MAG: hypothetical protein WA001_01620 [Patescibacteria group bacterium]
MQLIASSPRSSIAPMSQPDITSYAPAVLRFLDKNRLASQRYLSENPMRKHWLSTHDFLPEADICIDGRVQDFSEAMGMPMGLMELYRSAGCMASFRSLSYAQRTLKAVQKSQAVDLDGEKRAMVKLRIRTVHYSHSHPDVHSCAAWNNRTEDAVKAMQVHADELNYSFPGKMVAVVATVDTDFDAVTLIGPGGRFSVREMLDDPLMKNGQRPERIWRELMRVFPPDWAPLLALHEHARATFHKELTERLEANLQFVNEVIASERPVELLEHKETMLFVGRHVDWTGAEEHNSVFLIDDTGERDDVLNDFVIALRYVAKNAIKAAIKADDRNWSIPVMVNIPHDDADDEGVTIVYARNLANDLRDKLHEVASDVVTWLIHSDNAIPANCIPDWMFRQVHDFRSRVQFVTSRSYRKDRLFRLFE